MKYLAKFDQACGIFYQGDIEPIYIDTDIVTIVKGYNSDGRACTEITTSQGTYHVFGTADDTMAELRKADAINNPRVILPDN